MTKVTLEIRGKQVDRLLAMCLEHNLTIGGMLHAIINEYLGEPTNTKPIKQVKPAKKSIQVKRKPKPRRKKWTQDEEV